MSLEKKINLEKDENILAVIHKSLVHDLWWMVLGLVFILASSYFAFWLLSQGKYGLFILGFSVLIGILLFLKALMVRTKNFSVVTDKRVVDFKGEGFFNEEILEINLYEVQNILYFKKGILSKIFNYGDLSLENNQRQEILRLNKISSPEKAFHLVNRLKNDFWLKEKDLDIDEIIDMFIDNLSLIQTQDLKEIRECLDENLAKRKK